MQRLRLFVPLLAGATFGDRSWAALGAGLGVLVAGLAGIAIQAGFPGLPFLIAPIGASAVLVFAVPASPLAQPWPVFGGNLISAIIGVAMAQSISHPMLAIGLAVALAIIVMSLLRCLHPPSGAVAMTAILGGDAITKAGFAFPVTLVAANSAALLAMGWLYHRFSRHSYPHKAESVVETVIPSGLLRADIDLAIAESGETFDIDLDDLENLLLRAEAISADRQQREANADYSI
ncbi:MAG TPA: HPP family protein [Sphingorhabdus sp.]|nr:HPP family protein [Sphingorhabdus sp.]